MTTKTVTITAPNGLHTYTAAEFSRVANEYLSDIWIEKDNTRLPGKSLLGILSLGVGCGDEITLEANGPDEAEAIEGLVALLCNNMSRDGCTHAGGGR